MELGEIFTYIGTAVGGGGLGWIVNWKWNRRKEVASVKADEIENLRKTMQDFYEPLVNRQNERISELEAEVKTLREQLNYERNEHQQQIQNLQKQIIEITRVLGVKNSRQIREAKPTKKAEK